MEAFKRSVVINSVVLRSVAVGLLSIAFVTPARAQPTFSAAGRAGTLGWGGEVAVRWADEATVRGGAGISTLDADTRFGDFAARLELPRTWYDLGVDWYPTRHAFRISTGILFQDEDPLIEGVIDRPTVIGGQSVTPTELGALTGIVRTRDRIPYLRIGFGRHAAAGFGLFLDLGLGFLGSPVVELEADGGTLDPGTLNGLLEAEAASIQSDLKTYLRFWPIMSVGLRYGIGG